MATSRPVPANGHSVGVGLPAGGPVILFDGVCNLCAGFVRFVVARDPAAIFRFVAAQSALGTAILRDLGLSTDDYESNILIEGGRAYFKSEAYVRICTRLRQPWPMMRLMRLAPLGLRDWLYDRIAANRYAWFGRRDACLVPDPALAARFLG
ncbi:MAG TPA: thiol-disulfide oxidoreductase DCC family protein [Vineibacter sp.]|nr:thiol-disulfide oxidoreductase DCC family protein [Vineibacter sp.]